MALAPAPPLQVHARHGEGRKLAATMRQVLEGRVGQVAGTPEVEHALQVGLAAGPRVWES